MHDGRFKTLADVVEHYDHGLVAFIEMLTGVTARTDD
jgi:cytochrome c peroxidase